ncbi:hypothetical protein AADEFJLK_04414 [Methylovulum psychrotolerans]|uniref:Uncharacterized protein n=2 Tax=Methylovulum psychrotolerans TaxID=1704499 RepID=A0A2S5CG69_9GAMM|nr:hypothetical protein AADEFJLK_04414 [Methylovulum psychrotolerans]
MLQDAARFKFVTAKHMQKKYFGETKPTNSTIRLSQLLSAGFLSRVYFHPKIRGQEKAHPTGVFYFAKSNQNKLKTYLEENGQTDAFEDFVRQLPSYNKNDEYSQLYLSHELGITDFFFTLENETAESDTWTLAFWERTSPFSKEIGEHLDGYAPDPETGAKTQKLHFNPDAFFALRHRQSNAHLFYFLEFDNNTATAAKFRQKLFGYMAYHQQGRFDDLIARYNGKYLLGLRDTARAGFRVLTITPQNRRRDDLFLDSLNVRDESHKARYKMFLYAGLTDVNERGALSAAYLRGKEYAPIAEEQKTLPKDASGSALKKWQDTKISGMVKVAIYDE